MHRRGISTERVRLGTIGHQVNSDMRERSGSVVEYLTQDRGAAWFEPHKHHCVVVLEQDTFILA